MDDSAEIPQAMSAWAGRVFMAAFKERAESE